jgi:hypothetical protein
LSDLSLDAIAQGAYRHMRTNKFFPRPAELRDAAVGSLDDLAEIAWLNVLQLVRKVGWIGTPRWPDELTKRAAMELYGGWKSLCERLPGEGPELLGAAKQFKSIYRAIAGSERQSRLPVTPQPGLLSPGTKEPGNED